MFWLKSVANVNACEQAPRLQSTQHGLRGGQKSKRGSSVRELCSAAPVQYGPQKHTRQAQTPRNAGHSADTATGSLNQVVKAWKQGDTR